jgi:hypothetical protein
MSLPTTYTEKQYLGRDYNRISIRMVMALFCFAAYYFSENEANAELFLVVGFGILVLSILTKVVSGICLPLIGEVT